MPGPVRVELDQAAIDAFCTENAEAFLQPGAEKIAKRQSELAPRDPHSGDHMADHIVIEYDETGANIGPDEKYFYAAFVEHGTSKMPSEPFVRPSADG